MIRAGNMSVIHSKRDFGPEGNQGCQTGSWRCFFPWYFLGIMMKIGRYAAGALGDIFRILLSEMNHFIAILFSLLIALHAYINSCCCFNFKNSFPETWHAERLKAFWFCGCKVNLIYFSIMQYALWTVVYFTI